MLKFKIINRMANKRFNTRYVFVIHFENLWDML